MKNENRYSGSYFYIPFSVFKVGKGKRKLDYAIRIFHYGIGEWKTKGRYIQHVVVFRLSCFHLAKEKNENGYNGSYFYFSFIVWGLEKRKMMLSYPFSIFYYEIEKRKTKGRYIHGPWYYTTKGKPMYWIKFKACYPLVDQWWRFSHWWDFNNYTIRGNRWYWYCICYQNVPRGFTHWGRVTHIYISQLCHYCFR